LGRPKRVAIREVGKCDSVVVLNPASAIGVFLLLKSPEHVGLIPTRLRGVMPMIF
jgi:hypothetical protein